MEPSNLAQLLIGIAATAAVVLPLMLAAASLVFQSVITAAAELGRSSLEITASSLTKVVELDTELDAILNDGRYSDEDFTRLLQALSRIDFHPRSYRPNISDEVFRTELRRFVEQLTRIREERLTELRRRLAMAQCTGLVSDHDADYIKAMPRLELVVVPVQAALEAFERHVVLYGDVVTAWTTIRRDLLRTALPTTVLVVAAIAVAAAAWTHTPTLISSPLLNSIVAGGFVAGLALDLIWITLWLRPIARLF